MCEKERNRERNTRRKEPMLLNPPPSRYVCILMSLNIPPHIPARPPLLLLLVARLSTAESCREKNPFPPFPFPLLIP